MAQANLTPHELTLHGHRVTYRTAGRGPVLLLLHGIANSSQTWARVAAPLSERFTLIAPDLLGHGESATPRGDYSLGAHASGARDVLTALGHERVTVIGHSLGGGIAMQFAYQFPERCERLVLVSSGGLGREVHLLLRAAALPGADYLLPLLTSRQLLGVGRGLGALLRRARLAPGGDLEVLANGFASLDNNGSRQAFLHTVRAVIEPSGQRVSAHDRLALAAPMPTLIVWGERDSFIPVAHGVAAHAAMPGSSTRLRPRATTSTIEARLSTFLSRKAASSDQASVCKLSRHFSRSSAICAAFGPITLTDKPRASFATSPAWRTPPPNGRFSLSPIAPAASVSFPLRSTEPKTAATSGDASSATATRSAAVPSVPTSSAQELCQSRLTRNRALRRRSRARRSSPNSRRTPTMWSGWACDTATASSTSRPLAPTGPRSRSCISRGRSAS
jgi:pimeloyl-ACP methyl ester carboxylesterase